MTAKSPALQVAFDRLLIARALQESGGQQNRAAELLGLSRVTLRAKLRTFSRLQAERGESLERAK